MKKTSPQLDRFRETFSQVPKEEKQDAFDYVFAQMTPDDVATSIGACWTTEEIDDLEASIPHVYETAEDREAEEEAQAYEDKDYEPEQD